MVMRVLVTGTTGFVGSVLCDVLGEAGYVVRAALRSDRRVSASVAEKAIVGEIDTATQWKDALRGVDVVIHLAARVHILGDATGHSDLYVKTNAHGTRTLAEASAFAGVRRFVYLSSVKVNGEESSGKPYTTADIPHPRDAYGMSKWMAERCLTEIATKTGMETVSVRSPLVYGPGVRANFLRLMVWVDKEWPLPLGAIRNKRSLVSIWNLCDLLLTIVENPVAAGLTWMVSDGYDISTPELILRIGVAMNRRVRLWPVPVSALRLGGVLVRREAEIERLCGSLTVDITQTLQELRWAPPITLEHALARTVDWYLNTDARRAA